MSALPITFAIFSLIFLSLTVYEVLSVKYSSDIVISAILGPCIILSMVIYLCSEEIVNLRKKMMTTSMLTKSSDRVFYELFFSTYS